MITRLCFILWLVLPLVVKAQFTYTIDQSIPVEVEGNQLSLPWAGGLNSAQINTIDLNGDNKQDLAIFDRSSGKIQTFLNQDNAYVYAPDYEILFPPDVKQWMLLRDFNCDGKKDIFTSDPFGIAVFVNTTTQGGNLTFRRFNPGFPLLTEGFTSNINLKVNDSDIPAIEDMDGDGDLDVLNVKFVGTGTFEWHKNMSMELTGTCDSLQLKRITQNWGSFEECDCGDFAFGQTCLEKSGGRTNHTGGKTLSVYDLDNDGDKELFFSEESCTRLYMLTNHGDAENALMTDFTFFPAGNPVSFLIFPASFFEDVDFDGKPDLLASPNVYARTALNNPFTNSVWYYKNTGTTQVPNFTFVKNNFLQDQMIDVGDYAYPAFLDYDGDGDEDMFIGNYGDFRFIGVVALYENIGTPSNPSFKLITNDFASISQIVHYSVKPQFIDINGDGNIDLTMVTTDPRSFTTNLLYVPGKSSSRLDLSGQEIRSTEFQIGNNENLLLVDIDLDGKVDALVGKNSGALEYWKNNGSGDIFNFSLQSPAFMGLGSSVTRTNPTATVADLDADGRQDLVVGDQLGNLTIFGDFRGTIDSPQPVTEIIYDSFNETYLHKNLGGRIKPTAVNLFNSDKPAIAIGTVTGGMILLKNDGGQQLPEEPVITLYPNPLPTGEKLSVKSDRNTLMQIFSIMGQKLSEPFFITANQPYPIEISGLAPGMYIARFTIAGKRYGRKFIIY